MTVSFFRCPKKDESQDKKVYILTIFPSLIWNNVDVGPLLSHNLWNFDILSPFSDNPYLPIC